MEQLQGSLCLGLQGDHKIIKDLEDRKLYGDVHAAQANVELFTKIQQDHTLALKNLSMATQADRTLVALLTKTISELSIRVAHLTAKLATAKVNNARLKKLEQCSTPAKHGHQASINLTSSDTNSS